LKLSIKVGEPAEDTKKIMSESHDISGQLVNEMEIS